MTDQELLELVLAEGRASRAVMDNSRNYDRRSDPAVLERGRGLLDTWMAARDATASAVQDRLASEATGNPVVHGPGHPARVVRFEKETR